jgi:hypothetical protein
MSEGPYRRRLAARLLLDTGKGPQSPDRTFPVGSAPVRLTAWGSGAAAARVRLAR